MSAPVVEQAETVAVEPVEPDVGPTPALLWWAFAIPTFAVVVFGMQQFMKPRVRLEDVHGDDRNA
jgi:hypothetical protein